MDFKGNMFENEQTKDDILELVDGISNYDIFDFLAKISGLNLLPQNQNKSVLLDTLIQYVLTKEEINYTSTNKMSAGKFKSIINGLNSTNLSLSIDPCENVFIQNVMLGTNYRVFNGIDSTPAYNLQGNTLGDIDILIIDKVTNKIIAAEVKDFHFSRNPYEIQQEYLKMFVDNGKTKSFATKHKRRVEWLKKHIQDVRIQYDLDDREWNIKGVFIVSKPLISNAIYKQNIKCISRAELCAEIIRNI